MIRIRSKYREQPKTFWAKVRSDAADSMTAVLITMMPFILLFTGWAIDFTKNAAIRSEYMSIAQESAQAAIREQSGNGSLRCGQSSAMDNDTNLTETQHYRVDGVTNAQAVANGDYDHLQNKEVGFRPANARAIQLAIKTYLHKTGRVYNVSGHRVMGDAIYNDGGEADRGYGYTGGDNGYTMVANDGNFVRTMRTIIGNKDQQQSLDENEKTYANGLDVPEGGNNDTFSITIWCSKGLAAEQGKKNTNENNLKKTVGKAERFSTLNLEIHDWSGNFMLGMFDRNWAVQRYTLTPRATASWSQSAAS